jgi:ketosteroid isomerase-like protein
METKEAERLKREAGAVIYAFFEAGKNKDLTSISGFHAPAEVFTKFDESPPYMRQDSEEAFMYEQAAFANISDYEYKLDDFRIDLIGGAAVATFYLSYKGVFVNDYSFEGRTVGSKSRVTMVLAKFKDEWRIAHEHFSPFPELSRSADRKP